MKKGILVHESSDDVGVAVMDLKAGEKIGVATLEGKDVRQITLVTDVPLGHKVAMADLPLDKHIIEYGRPVGYAVAPIRAGEHVHIHNIKSLRWAASKADVLEK
jgi:(2R)-sulfolactate sulfo-lyase subunit alpha